MKKVYFVQPNNSLSGSLFLPYAVASLASYVFNFEEIRKEYEFSGFIFTKSDIEETVNSILDPSFVGFSCYMWNIEYNLSLAEQLKKAFPKCVIAFGGPSIPDDTEYLEKYQFIDILMHGEGEVSLYNLLTALSQENELHSIKNISFRSNGIICKTIRECSSNDLSDYPSPYAEGYFDSIVNDPKYKDVQFDAILETNRGCPYGCTYCSWAGTAKSFRTFSISRIKSDLYWMSQNKISFCICADSNFGILERDKEIAEYIVSLKSTYGYPEKFETTAAKNKNDFVFEINETLERVGLNRGVSVAVQSMSETVLANVGRTNISIGDLSNELKRYRESKINTYTDIILGLPGETFESFCKGLFDVIEAGQHSSININRCELIPNTILYSKEEREKFKIKTIRSHLCQNHSQVSRENTYGARSEIIVETSTMSKQEWRNAVRLSTCVQSFHCMGIIKYLAVYLRKAKDISYHDFYISLYEWIEKNDSFIKSTLDSVCKTLDEFINNNSDLFFSDKKFGDIYWPFDEGLFLYCVSSLDEFFSDVAKFIVIYFQNDEELLYDLLKYQKEIIAVPFKKTRTIQLTYNWPDYFKDIFSYEHTSPKRESVKLEIKNINIDSWFDYAKEIVWFGRRSNLMINKNVEITYAES